MPTDTAGRETGVTGVSVTGRCTSVDVVAVVFVPAAVLPDTVGLSLVTCTPEEMLAAERDADGITAAEVAGRLTREGSPPAADFPVFFAALSRAS